MLQSFGETKALFLCPTDRLSVKNNPSYAAVKRSALNSRQLAKKFLLLASYFLPLNGHLTPDSLA